MNDLASYVPMLLSVLGIGLILWLTWLGIVFGVFYELTSATLLFLAMMVTLRYWYEAARWVESVMPGAGAYGAFGAYWAMFLVGCVPLILVLNRVTDQAVPRYPKIIDVILGIVFAFIAATILVCCIFTSLSIIVPKIWGGYNPAALTMHFDQYPLDAYQHIEEEWLRVPKSDPGHTRFPQCLLPPDEQSTAAKGDEDNFQTYWK